MNDKRDGENVVPLKKPNKEKKRSKEKRIESADGIEAMLENMMFGNAGAPDTDAVKYQIAQSAATIRGAYGPVADVLGRMAAGYEKMCNTIAQLVETNNRVVEVNNHMVANQNRMVAAIEALADRVGEFEDRIEDDEEVEIDCDWIVDDVIGALRRDPRFAAISTTDLDLILADVRRDAMTVLVRDNPPATPNG
jgi:hypothetical protein